MLFELSRSMQALSPFHIALREARSMARHHLHFQEGGPVPHEGRVEDRDDEGDFLLPPDVDPMAVALAINERLREAEKLRASAMIQCGGWRGEPVVVS